MLGKAIYFAVRWFLLLFTLAIIAGGALTWKEQKNLSMSGMRVFAIGGGRAVVGCSPESVAPDASIASIQKFMRTRKLWDATPDPLRVQSSIVGSRDWMVAVPLWMPLTVFGLLAALTWSLRIRAVRRAKAGSCPDCGYSRVGLATDASCPECGSTPARAPATSPG